MHAIGFNFCLAWQAQRKVRQDKRAAEKENKAAAEAKRAAKGKGRGKGKSRKKGAGKGESGKETPQNEQTDSPNSMAEAQEQDDSKLKELEAVISDDELQPGRRQKRKKAWTCIAEYEVLRGQMMWPQKNVQRLG